MVTAVVGVVIAGLLLALVLAVARDTGPTPADAAFSYELAWDHFDFDSLWALSGDELRDGLGRKAFVSAKTAAYSGRRALGHLARSIEIEEVESRGTAAIVRTRVDLHDGDAAHNEIHLAKRASRWVVVEYRLRAEAPPVPPS